MKFTIGITEILHRDFELEADSLEGALAEAQSMWRYQKVILDKKDLEQTRIVAEDDEGEFGEWLYD